MRTFRADVCSLYRRSLRMAALSVPEHRAWMLRYVRDRFRDVPAGADFARRVREGEEELERHILTLRRAGRLPVDGCHAAVAAPPSLGPPAAAPSVDAPLGSPAAAPLKQRVEAWSCSDVCDWLERDLALETAAVARFRSHHVDGPLLLLLDDQDLRDELGVASRLLRKRILSNVSRLS